MTRVWLPLPDGTTAEAQVRGSESPWDAAGRWLEETRGARSPGGPGDAAASPGDADRAAVAESLAAALRRAVVFDVRADLGRLAEAEGFTVGAELGVQRGVFARQLLAQWPSAARLVLVDAWSPLEHYADPSNAPQARQDANYAAAVESVRAFRERGVETPVCRDLTTACVRRFPDAAFDFIYLDAAHDFKSVYRDVSEWWPKLRPGGVFAGHDYVTQDEGPERLGFDWTLNHDGTVDETRTVAKGAVNRFAQENGLVVSTGRFEEWPSWAMRKPREGTAAG